MILVGLGVIWGMYTSPPQLLMSISQLPTPSCTSAPLEESLESPAEAVVMVMTNSQITLIKVKDLTYELHLRCGKKNLNKAL